MKGAVAVAALAVLVEGGPALAQAPLPPRGPVVGTAPRAVVVDRARVRYFAPELGGATHPRFITERMLGFEARLEAMTHEGWAPEIAPEERHVRSAVDLHVARELLAAMPEVRPTATELARVARELRRAMEARAGGSGAIARAAAIEGLDTADVDMLFERQARAAVAVDRVLSPVLEPAEEQIRDVFRTANHPFRDRPLDEVKEAFVRWYVEDRLRILEVAFLQGARARVRVVMIDS